MKWIYAALFAVTLGALAQAQTTVSSGPSAVISGGPFTIATLPTCDAGNQGRYAFASDLGGGPDTVLCDGTFWKHIRLGSPTVVSATSGNITITPLASAPVELISNPSAISNLNFTVDPTNLYPGYILYIRVPGLLTGSLGIKVAGGAVIPLAGNSTSMFIYDGQQLQRIQ